MQRILRGISLLGSALEGLGKVLLVCGNSYASLNIRDDIERYAREAGCTLVRFGGFSPNPSYESVCEGVRLFRETSCEAVLAVGGGSAMDVAKCIKLFCRMHDGEVYTKQPYRDTGVKLIAIPTTAGSGSESTRYAVIYVDGEKYSVTHDSIIPDVAILEPSVIATLPLYQKKCAMMDALCQGIESWWSVNSTPESRELSRLAVRGIMASWKEYIFGAERRAGDYAPEAAVMEASNLAGRAICITQTTAPHAFSYKLTSLFGLPHGHAVAVCLPEIWEFMLSNQWENIDVRLFEVFADISSSLLGDSRVDIEFSDLPFMARSYMASHEAIGVFRRMMDTLELDRPVSSDREADIAVLAASVNPVRLANNPVAISRDDAARIYSKILLSQP